MSDLSQLYINQQNKVSLYIDDNIKLNNVYLPRSFNNLIDDGVQQPMILGIDSFDSTNTICSTSLYQKPFASIQSDSTPQLITSAQTVAISFPGSDIVIQKGVGLFSGGTLELPVPGYYRFTYSLVKSWADNTVEGVCDFFISVNANLGGNVLGVKSSIASAGAGTAVISDSFIGLINGQPNKIVLGCFTDISSGEFAITYPTLTAELISPYIN